MRAIIVTTTTDSLANANEIAAAAIERRLAACGQIVGPIQSVYRWRGKVERSTEFRCELKTTSDRYHELDSMIQELHTYDVPEIIAVQISHMSKTYRSWLEEQTGDDS